MEPDEFAAYAANWMKPRRCWDGWKSWPFRGPRRNFLRAALMLQRGDWIAARNELEAVRPLLTADRQLTVRCDLLVAECCERAGERETELLICRRALALDPQQTGARLRLITTLQGLGRIEEALEECRHLMAGARAAACRLAAPGPADERAKPTAARRPAKVDGDRSHPRSRRRDQRRRQRDCPTQGPNAAGAEGHSGGLPYVGTRLPKQPAPRRAVAGFGRCGDPRRQARVGPQHLQRRRETAGRWSELAPGPACVLLAYPDSAKALRDLEIGLDKVPDEERGRVLAALAEAHLQANRVAEARRLWNEVARLRPRDLDARLRCFDLAVQDNEESGMNDALASVRNLEGEGGTFSRYDHARSLLWRALRGDKSGLETARLELDVVGKRRPNWSRVYLCLGQVSDLEGQEERALVHYLRAIELGERQLDLVRRVVRLLYDRHRYTEAELVLQRLPEQSLIAGDMPQLVAEVSMQSGNFNRAPDLARQAIKADSRDYRDYIWLGQILWAAAQRAEISDPKRRAAEEEAEKALYHAVELAGNAPEGWVALVQHLVRTRQTDKAQAQVEKRRSQLPAEKAALALAQCYAVLNKLDKARQFFDAAPGAA